MAAEKKITFDYRKWRGERGLTLAAYRKYDFPVTIRKVGDPAPAPASAH